MRVFRMKNLCLVLALVLAILPLFSYMGVAQSLIETPVEAPDENPGFDEPDDPLKEAPVEEAGDEAPEVQDLVLVLPDEIEVGIRDFEGPMTDFCKKDGTYSFEYTFRIKSNNKLFFDEFPEDDLAGEEIYAHEKLVELTESANGLIKRDITVRYFYDEDDKFWIKVWNRYNEDTPLLEREVGRGRHAFYVEANVDDEYSGQVIDLQVQEVLTTPFGLKYSVELMEDGDNQYQQLKILHTNIGSIVTGQGIQYLMDVPVEDGNVPVGLQEDCYIVNLTLDPMDYEAKASPYYMDFDFGFDWLTLDYNSDDFVFWADRFDDEWFDEILDEIPVLNQSDTIKPWQLFFKAFLLGDFPEELSVPEPDPVPGDGGDEGAFESEAYSEDLLSFLPGLMLYPDLKFITYYGAKVEDGFMGGNNNGSSVELDNYFMPYSYYSELNAQLLFYSDKNWFRNLWMLENDLTEAEMEEEDVLTESKVSKGAKYYVIIDDVYYPIYSYKPNTDNGREGCGFAIVPMMKHDEFFYLYGYRNKKPGEGGHGGHALVELEGGRHGEPTLLEREKYLEEMPVSYLIEWVDWDEFGPLHSDPDDDVEIPMIQINDVSLDLVFDDFIDAVVVNDFDWFNTTTKAMGTVVRAFDFTDMELKMPATDNANNMPTIPLTSGRTIMFMDYHIDLISTVFNGITQNSLEEDCIFGRCLHSVYGHAPWTEDIGMVDPLDYTDYTFIADGPIVNLVNYLSGLAFELPFLYNQRILFGEAVIATSGSQELGEQFMIPVEPDYVHNPARELIKSKKFHYAPWTPNEIGFYFNAELIDFEFPTDEGLGEDGYGLRKYYYMSALKFVAPYGRRDYAILRTGDQEYQAYWDYEHFVMPLKLGIDGNYTAFFDGRWRPLVDNEFELTLYDEMGDDDRHAIEVSLEEEGSGYCEPRLPVRIFGKISDEITEDYLKFVEPETEFMFEEYYSPTPVHETPEEPSLIPEEEVVETVPEVPDRDFYLNIGARFADYWNTYGSMNDDWYENEHIEDGIYEWDDQDTHNPITDHVPLTRIQLDVDYYENELDGLAQKSIDDMPYVFRFSPVSEYIIDFYGETFGEFEKYYIHPSTDDINTDEYTTGLDDDDQDFRGKFGWTVENMSFEIGPGGLPEEDPDEDDKVYAQGLHELTPTAMMLFMNPEFEVVEEFPGSPNVLRYNFGTEGYEFGEDCIELEGNCDNGKEKLDVRVYNNIPEVIDGNKIYNFETFTFNGNYVDFEVKQDENGWYLQLIDTRHNYDGFIPGGEVELFGEDSIVDYPEGWKSKVKGCERFDHRFYIGNINEPLMVMLDRTDRTEDSKDLFFDSERRECNTRDIMIYHGVSEEMKEDRSDYGAEFSHELYVVADRYYLFYDVNSMDGLFYNGNETSPYNGVDPSVAGPAVGSFGVDDAIGAAMVDVEMEIYVEEEIVAPELSESVTMVNGPGELDILTTAFVTKELVGSSNAEIINANEDIRSILSYGSYFDVSFTNWDDFMMPDYEHHDLTNYAFDRFIGTPDPVNDGEFLPLTMVSEASDIVTYRFGEGTLSVDLLDMYGVRHNIEIDSELDQSDPDNRMISFTQTHSGSTIYYNHPDLAGPVAMGGQNDDFTVIFNEDHWMCSMHRYDEFETNQKPPSMEPWPGPDEVIMEIHVVYDSSYRIPVINNDDDDDGGGGGGGGTATTTILEEDVALALPEYLLPYIAGYPGQVFIPDNFLNRQQLATMVYRLSGLNPILPETDTFPDVSPELWSYEYIETVNALELMGGQFNGYFGPSNSMTMGQFLEVMANYLDYFGVEYIEPEESPFGLPTTTMHYDDLLRVYATGALDEYTEFNTIDLVMRKDAVRIINRIIGRSTEFETAPEPTFLDVTILHPYFYDIEAASRIVTPEATQ